MNASNEIVHEKIYHETYLLFTILGIIILGYVGFRCCGIYQRRDQATGVVERGSRRGSRMAL